MDPHFLMSLPDDPEEAFPYFEEAVRAQCHRRDDEGGMYFDQRAYVCHLLGFAQAYNMDIGVRDDIPVNPGDFNRFFTEAQTKIQIFLAKAQVNVAKRKKDMERPAYELDANLRMEITEVIELTRTRLDQASIPQKNRDIIHDKINAFEQDVTESRTKLGAMADLYVYCMRAYESGARDLRPVIGCCRRLFQLLSKAEPSSPVAARPLTQANRNVRAQGPRRRLSFRDIARRDLEKTGNDY